jgi:hypothetical protein
MDNIVMSVETVGLEKIFHEIEDLGGKKAGVILRERAGLLGRICAERTQPVVDQAGGAISASSVEFSGASPAARKMGEAAVIRDIARVYTTASAIFKEVRATTTPEAARAFYRMVKRGEYNQAEDFLRKLKIRVSALQIQAWDDGSRHRQLRSSQGRIAKGKRPIVIGDIDALRAYIKTVKARVGYTKSGWINAARQIQGAKGLSKVPQWIKKHSGPGSARDGTRSGENPYIVLTNLVPWIGKVFGGRQESQALRGFDELIAKDLLAQLRHLRARNSRFLAAA